MDFFLDTANIEEIKAGLKLGVISGVTTNPLLASKEQKEKSGSFKEMIREIAALVPGPVSAEVVSTCSEDMIPEARELAKIADNVVIKIPVSMEGLQTVHALSAEGIKTNVTLIFSANQALLAAKAGATFVSPFIGRLEDINVDAVSMIRDTCEIFHIHGLSTKIIAASVRTPAHATQAALAGSDIATVPYKLLSSMLHHPMTDSVNQLFLEAWAKANFK